jgi:hypothetical protein
MSIPTKFHLYSSKIPHFSPKFHVCSSKIPCLFLQNSNLYVTQFHIYNEETSDVMHESNDLACVEGANVFVTNQTHSNLN